MSRKSVVSLVLLLLLFAAYEFTANSGGSDVVQIDQTNDSLVRLKESEQSGVMVSGSGVVTRVLADDNEGSRHQRFILSVASGMTVLVSHNIDLAPRVPLSVGDSVEFRGQYEWNSQGGVIHWTHHDPAGRHAEGWIDYDGTRYE